MAAETREHRARAPRDSSASRDGKGVPGNSDSAQERAFCHAGHHALLALITEVPL